MKKKIFALLLAVLLCLSLFACGEKVPVDDSGNGQQENNEQQQPTLEEILCTGEWYYLGLRTPGGLVFDEDGTISGGTWTLRDTTLDCVWKSGTTTQFELRNIKGAYFMTDEDGITLYNYSTKPADWYSLGLMIVDVRCSSWEDHLEVVCVDGQYRLQLKKQYMQALLANPDNNSYLEITYSQGSRQGVQVKMTFDAGPNGYYIEIENPAEVPLEIDPIGGGVIYILTDLM